MTVNSSNSNYIRIIPFTCNSLRQLMPVETLRTPFNSTSSIFPFHNSCKIKLHTQKLHHLYIYGSKMNRNKVTWNYAKLLSGGTKLVTRVNGVCRIFECFECMTRCEFCMERSGVVALCPNFATLLFNRPATLNLYQINSSQTKLPICVLFINIDDCSGTFYLI